MLPVNFYMYFVAALIPMVIGAVYYHPKVVGGAWMKTNGFTTESLESGNMAVIFGVAYLMSFILAFGLTSQVIHQTSVAGLLMPEAQDAASAIGHDMQAFMEKYGNRHRTFSHGAVHAIILSIFTILPILTIVANFERRGAKYIFVHFGYWLITLALMGGLLCATLKWV